MYASLTQMITNLNLANHISSLKPLQTRMNENFNIFPGMKQTGRFIDVSNVLVKMALKAVY